ncbi:MAG: NADH-ubiquinone oxidoreductase-F iron-sulfur binding region domain-containing protein [Patescibacteria group bacterium]
MKNKLIQKIEKAKLVGRGGAGFLTHLKWQAMLDAKSSLKFLVCNGSEGERETYKDGYILTNYPEEVINGMRLAFENLGITKGYIYLKPEYFKIFAKKLKKIIGGLNIEIFEEYGGYLAGEETTLCNVIEGKLAMPRQKPPYPTDQGINNQPTLINNVETLYQISKIAKDKYQNIRFCSLAGEVKNKGVFELPATLTIEEILKQTKNYPNFEFFVQAGGGWSGSILLSSELNQAPAGTSGIIVYRKNSTTVMKLAEKLIDFFVSHNCDKCVPCREGTYRLQEMIKSKKIDELKFKDLIFTLENTSFCPYGKSLVIPFKDIYNKLLKC